VLENLQAVLAIVLIDLALSGDNALVIGMAARNLPERQRGRAILIGGIGAVVLRVAAAAAVTLLLAIPYLQLVAAIVLVVIAYRLVQPASDQGRSVRQAASLPEAILTILLADAAMSLENILGVGAAAHGSIALLVFGLGLSIPIVLFGSGLIVRALDRFPQGIWLGALALLWTAAEMIVDEPSLALRGVSGYSMEMVLTVALLAIIVVARGARSLSRRSPRRSPAGARLP
jgi:YjbE family integral membrane protein